MSRPIPVATLAAYAAPAFVMAFPTIPVLIQVPVLYGVDRSVGLAMTGLLLFASRLFDSLTDPLVGWASDRFAFRGTRRKPWIAAGAVIAAIGLVQLLVPPPEAGALHLLAWSVVLYTGWTMVQVPYAAWGAELSQDYDQRTRVTAWREAATLLGVLGASALAALAGAMELTGTDATALIAWTAIAAGVLALPVMFAVVPEPDMGTAAANAGADTILSLAKNGPFVRLLTAWFVNGLANGIPAALYLLYLEHGLGLPEAERPLYIFIYFLAAVVAIPGWRALSTAWSKHAAWNAAMVAACVAFACVPFLQPGAFTLYLAISIVTGAALGADLALPPALQADVVDYDRLKHGTNRVGLQFALWSMSAKIALAASAGIALPLVSLGGFDVDAVSETGRLWLVVVYGGLPVLLKVGAIALMRDFPIDRRRQRIIARRLATRDR